MTYNRRRLPLALLAAAFALLTLRPAACADTPRKHALLIGISDYSKLPHALKNQPEELEPLFPDLDCDEDVDRIKAALVQTFKFDPDPAKHEIVVLKQPEQTTRKAILAAFDRLIAETHPGDLVYIHYSGHGQQVTDNHSPGGLDDAIVPSDYLNDLSNLITGKKIAEKLKALQAQDTQGDVHGQIALSFDCCHSATATRGGLAKKRGKSYKEFSEWYERHYHALPPQPAPESAMPELARGAAPSAKVVIQDLNQPGYVVLSACTNDSFAFETQDESGQGIGRFSLALSQAMIKANKDTTYQQLYDQVYELFREKYNGANGQDLQVPQIDGAADTKLLGGSAVPSPSAILVRRLSPGHFALDAGRLQGITAGSTFAVYPTDIAADFTPEKKIADVTVQENGVGLITATLQVDKTYPAALSHDALRGAYAVEVSHDYGSAQFTVDAPSITAALPPAQAEAVVSSLAKDPMVSTTLAPNQIPDIRVIHPDVKLAARAASQVQIIRGDTGTVLNTLDTTQDDLPAQFDGAVKKLASYRYATTVLNQENPNAPARIHLRLIPALSPDLDANGDPVVDANNLPVFKGDKPGEVKALKVGDYFTVEVQNLSDKDLFVTVLDIDSDGTIDQVWPDKEYKAANNIVKAGATVRLWNLSDTASFTQFKANELDNDEIYKALATDTHVSYQALVNRSTRGEKGPPSVFDALLEPATGTRGAGAVRVKAPVGWATSTVHFQVK